MAKKKHDVMAKEREIFINGLEEDGKIVVPGCVRNGVSAEIASQLFDEMTAFASYAFNKSHAAAYGVVAVRTGLAQAPLPGAVLLPRCSIPSLPTAARLQNIRSTAASTAFRSSRRISIRACANSPSAKAEA